MARDTYGHTSFKMLCGSLERNGYKNKGTKNNNLPKYFLDLHDT